MDKTSNFIRTGGMTMRQKIAETNARADFYRPAEANCPYFPHRKERKLITILRPKTACAQMDLLVAEGFRRMQDFAYAPDCRDCHACVSYRLPVAAFQPSRQQKRVMRTHADLSVSWVAPKASFEQYKLFQKYQNARHRDGSMQAMAYEAYREIVEINPVRSGLLEMRTANRELVCVSLFDLLERSVSATYTFYAADSPKRSYGVYAILQLIALCQSRRLPHLYLGHWIAENAKMAYKRAFQPAEILCQGLWKSFDAVAAQEPCAHPTAAQPRGSSGRHSIV